MPVEKGAPREFRLDINALRALAVSSVLLYHFQVWPFGGGYIGVDVFFVISGFLMTGIITRQIETRSFNFWGFLYARAKRIIPALAVMCGVVVVLNCLFIDPMTTTDTAQNAFYSVLFVSNLKYAFENAYFAGASENNWLLHTWSLSVEWQFYIIFPLVVFVLSRIGVIWRHKLAIMLASTLVLMIAAVIVSGKTNATFQIGFFILPTRAWEFLLGSCVAYAPPFRVAPLWARLISFVSIVSIIAGACTIDSATPWPSWWTAWPVIASGLVIWANNQRGIWLEAAPIQKLGTWSYSIYLWHWPVVACLAYFGLRHQGYATLPGIVVSIVLGAISYRLIETRLRDFVFNALAKQRAFAVAVLAFCAVLAVSAATWQSNGWESLRTASMPAQVHAMLVDYRRAATDWSGGTACKDHLTALPSGGHICTMGPNAKDVAVLGDSHVEQLIPRYAEWAKSAGEAGITFIYKDGCLPIANVDAAAAAGFNCAAFLSSALDKIKQDHFKRLVIISSWSVYFYKRDGTRAIDNLCFITDGECHRPRTLEEHDALTETAIANFAQQLQALKRGGMDIVILSQNPILLGETALSFYRQTFYSDAADDQTAIDLNQFKERTSFSRNLVEQLAKLSNAQLIDPANSLCREDQCPIYDDGKFIFKDGNHIRSSLIAGKRYDFFDPLLIDKGIFAARD